VSGPAGRAGRDRRARSRARAGAAARLATTHRPAPMSAHALSVTTARPSQPVPPTASRSRSSPSPSRTCRADHRRGAGFPPPAAAHRLCGTLTLAPGWLAMVTGLSTSTPRHNPLPFASNPGCEMGRPVSNTWRRPAPRCFGADHASSQPHSGIDAHPSPSGPSLAHPGRAPGPVPSSARKHVNSCTRPVWERLRNGADAQRIWAMSLYAAAP